MNSRSHSKSLGNRFLNFIGVIETKDDSDDYDQDYQQRPRGKRQAARQPDDEFGEDPFEETPPRAARNAPPRQGASRYDAVPDWRTGTRGNDYGAAQRAAQRPAASGNYRQETYRPEGYRAEGYRSESHRQDSYRPDGSYEANRPKYAPHEPTQPARPAAESQSSFRSGAPEHQTIIFKLRSVEECKSVILSLVEKKSVLINLEQADSVTAQRILDMLCGAAYAIDTRPRKVNEATWLIAPKNVAVNEDGDATGAFQPRRFF